MSSFFAKTLRNIALGLAAAAMPLLAASDVSYTFPYAPKEVQEAATYVVPTIVDALEHSMKDPV